MELHHSKQTRIYERVVESIKASIARQELQSGDPLPPERQLMEEMKVSRSSLREGFRVLELLGLIESIPGKGRFVRHAQLSTQSGGIKLENAAILELMEARKILDPAMAAEAARRGTPSDMTRLRRIIASTQADLETIAHRAQSDFDFHLAIADAAHNFLFSNIVRMEFNLIMATHEHIYSHLVNKESFINEHTGMYEAILDRDPELAGTRATQHIDRIYKTLHEAFAMEADSEPVRPDR